MKITPDVFEAYLKCPTKCWLRATDEPSAGDTYPEWVKAQNDSYRVSETRRLVAEFPNNEVALSPDMKNFKAAKWRLASSLAVQAQMDSCALESELHALERVPAEGRAKPTQFIPIRFVFTNKLSKDDKLLLAFDAFVLSELLCCDVSCGKIVHGDDHATRTVKTVALAGKVRKIFGKIATLLASHSPPDLVLNRHCAECEFRLRCRQKAMEKDDLSLLSGMTEKERKHFNRKGIFTVTQLSFTFRPRRRLKRLAGKREKYQHSLKALAIRNHKIYIVGSPEFKIEGTPVYLDVEGLPDRDFYYLIGIRAKTAQGFVEHSLWADGPDDERRIWTDFLRVVSSIESPVLIHYGRYESIFLKRMCQRYGEPPDSMPAKAIKAALNLVSVLFGQVYLPTYSNGLKESASFVGAQWRSSDVSGLQTIVWRCQWERTHVGSLKDQLIAYNQDDCAALTLLTEELLKLRLESKTRTNVDFADTPKQHATERGTEIHRNFEELLRSAHMRYSQKSIRFRKREGDTGADTSKRNTSPVFKKHKLSTRKARAVPVPRKRKCPRHPAQDLMPSERTANHTLLDLEFNKNGCRKVVVRYCGKRSYCPLCHRGHLPPAVKRLHNQVYGRGFQAWAVYQRVVLRLPYALIAKAVQDILHENISVSIIDSFVQRCSEQFAYTETLLLRNILQGLVIHVDETKISIRGVHQFVWVITDGSRVMFRLTETRETDFLRQLLAGYSGTLVSDFYAGYDALPFRQQKCLVHLVRDLNDDLWKNPFNDEYEQFVSSVRDVLVPILEDIRRFGLKVLHLRKHQKQVDRFYRDTICGRSGSHEITVKYQKRFERYRNSIFSFLGSDGIPWNNNAAERALRHLAVQRKISGVFSSKGANHYLRLLAIAQTCRFQNKSFLGFLLSGCVDVDEYSEGRRRQANLCPWV